MGSVARKPAVEQPVASRWRTPAGRLSRSATLLLGLALVLLTMVWGAASGAYAIAPAQLPGIVQAYALMRPEGMDGMTVKSLKKKFKDKHFAAKCSRDIIKKGFDMLELDGSIVMQCCIDGMQAHKEELGF